VRIEVRLFSYLCKWCGKEGNRHSFVFEIERDATCADLLSALKIPQEIPKIILINETVKEETYPLEEGDVVSILPPIDGG